MTKIIKSLSCAALLGCGSLALADEGVEGSGIFLEPGVTYQMTESNINYPTPFTNSAAVTRGFGLVLRGGAHIYERFFIAADARYGFLQYKDNANNLTTDANSWDIAPVVGFQMKDYGLRLYGGYVLAGELDPKSANGFDYKFKEPNGWRLGAGLKLKQFSVNIEWQRLNYTRTTVESLGSIAAGTSTDAIKYDGDGVVASVTFPIEFN
ncbi:MAG: outer membrane beta-barrel protein [Bdellovibrionales bacterium]|nr:outer membrane beta-barrel protein [Bdellovibrionales bacterium]